MWGRMVGAMVAVHACRAIMVSWASKPLFSASTLGVPNSASANASTPSLVRPCASYVQTHKHQSADLVCEAMAPAQSLQIATSDSG